MEDIPFQNIQFSIKNLVNQYGLEGAFELIENMVNCDMKYRLEIEYQQLYQMRIT